MKRKISGFHRDDVGDWVAELECGHYQLYGIGHPSNYGRG